MKYYTQLQSIRKAAGWSQEQLAQKLNVSFVTLNSWINQRSMPRPGALHNIDKLYLDIIGVDEVAPDTLLAAKQVALRLKSSVKRLTSSKEMLDKLALYMTYHTNTIEGSTMTLSDVENVIFEHKLLINRTAVEQAEARNHQAALYWLLDELVKQGNSFAIDETVVLGLHLRLMNGIIGDAGQYRTHSVRLMGSHVALANWVKIPSLVNELTKELKNSSQDSIKLLASTHARFEQIHPFSDGNGRTGRLIMVAQALQHTLLPPLLVKERKYAYYKYLELAQTNGNYAPLELFVAESIAFTDELLNI